MLHLKFRRHWLFGFLGLMLILMILVVGTGMAQTSIIPSNVAISLALSYSKDDGLVGGLVGQPAEMYGKVMTYSEATEYVLSQPINPGDGIAKISGNPVWLIILQGKIVEHVPSAPDIPAKDVIHNQMAVIIDGNTGEILERILISPQTTLSLASLPVLTMPSGTVPAAPTKMPIFTEIPLPTATPIR